MATASRLTRAYSVYLSEGLAAEAEALRVNLQPCAKKSTWLAYLVEQGLRKVAAGRR